MELFRPMEIKLKINVIFIYDNCCLGFRWLAKIYPEKNKVKRVIIWIKPSGRISTPSSLSRFSIDGFVCFYNSDIYFSCFFFLSVWPPDTWSSRHCRVCETYFTLRIPASNAISCEDHGRTVISVFFFFHRHSSLHRIAHSIYCTL